MARDRVPRGSAEGVAACEDERRWLARELHDGPAQSLAAALFGVDLALTTLLRAPTTAGEELRAARGLVRDALDDVRALMAGLRPPLLEERGLLGALQSLIANLPLWGPEVTLETRGKSNGKRLSPEIELALFRIAQEALSNARRHARAERIAITLAMDTDAISLEVADDGCGFATDAVWPAVGGEGLRGMRERAERLGADYVLASVPGKGTRVSVTVPLPPARGKGAEVREGDE